VASIKDNAGHTTTYAYDSKFGNLRQVMVPGNRATNKTFDALGRDSVIELPTLAAQTASYDIMNRVTRTAAAGSAITLTYDNLFQTDLYDANGNHYHADYNALGWPIKECDAFLKCTTTRYDVTGSVTSSTNRRNQRVDLTWDGAGRLTSQSAVGMVTNNYSYSPDGRSMVAWNPIERDSIFMNPGTQTLPATDSVVTWVRDSILGDKRFRVFHRPARQVADSDLTTITSNTGVTFYNRTAIYTSSGFLSSLNIGGQITTFTPDVDGTAATNSIPGGGTRTSHALATHVTADVSFSSPSLNQVFQRQYHYDPAGRIDQVMSGNLKSFVYDGLGRLYNTIQQTGCAWGNAWPTDTLSGPFQYCSGTITEDISSHDAMGNRMDRGGVPTTGNRYTRLNAANYYYDADGNVIQKFNNNGLYNRQWYWNANSQLDSAIKDSWFRTSYNYNALGNPVRIWDGDKNTRHVARYLLWDGDALIAEFWPNGQRDLDYIYLPGTVDRPFASTQGATTPTEIRYQELDELDNVIGTDQAGLVRQSNYYDSWGTVNSSSADSHLFWKGLFWNGDLTGLYYMRNRWYDPEGGRFVNEDPVGHDGGINLYSFAGEDPVNGADPSGLCSKIKIWFVTLYFGDCGQPNPRALASGPPVIARDVTAISRIRRDEVGDAAEWNCQKVAFTTGASTALTLIGIGETAQAWREWKSARKLVRNHRKGGSVVKVRRAGRELIKTAAKGVVEDWGATAFTQLVRDGFELLKYLPIPFMDVATEGIPGIARDCYNPQPKP
jgi:RHS repeat-associated protein